ncbi:Protein cornichon 4 [Glycine soja]
MADLFAWLISFFLLIALLVLVMYQLMCLADLEFDYINPYDSSARINMVVLPEYITQAVLCCFYLLTGHWIMALFCLPYLSLNLRLYRQGRHLVDVTEIFNLLSWEKKQRLVKLFYLVFTLFLSVFWGGNSRERLSFEGRLNQHPQVLQYMSQNMIEPAGIELCWVTGMLCTRVCCWG